MLKIRLSDINIDINGDTWVLEQNFMDFTSEFNTPDIRWDIVFSDRIGKDLYDPDERSKVLSINSQSVFRSNDETIIRHHIMNIPALIIASRDWSDCRIFLHTDYNRPDDEQNVTLVQGSLFLTLRKLLIFALSYRAGAVIHSASIVWKDKGVLFSAPSGTGKSTHVHLWKTKYRVPILDGDNAACRIIDGRPMVYGLPWCGTSGEYMNARLPLGAIVFLEQAPSNSIVRLDTAEAAIRLYSRCFQYSWDEQMVDRTLETTTDIVATSNCYLLKCRPDEEAVELVKQCLEIG
jgi:hypothetical protein